MFPLHFHYEDVSCHDPLLKPNHANVMEVPGLCETRLIPKRPSSFTIQNGKLAMEIPCGQRFIQTQRGSTGNTLQGHGMSNFSVRILIVMSLLDSPVEIWENSIQFLMQTEFYLEHIGRFNVTIVTSPNTQDETLPPWRGFFKR
ncbi:hypothetical protein AAG906_018468 [Vitis piasezkii]